PIKDTAAIVDDPIDELATLAYLGGGVGRRIDRQVLELVGALEVGVGTDPDGLDGLAVLDDSPGPDLSVVAPLALEFLLGKVIEPALYHGVVAVTGPKVGV